MYLKRNLWLNPTYSNVLSLRNWSRQTEEAPTDAKDRKPKLESDNVVNVVDVGTDPILVKEQVNSF